MGEYKDLDDYLDEWDEIEKRKKFLIFTDLYYRPTSERVKQGFRYFHCHVTELLEAFANRDFEAIAALPFAIDEDGDEETSSVVLDLAYTDSGTLMAAQPVEYQDSIPVPMAEFWMLEAGEGKSFLPVFKKLDQSS